MQEIVNAQAVIEPQIEGVSIKLGKVRVEKPRVTEADGTKRALYPMEARMRDLTYSAPVFLEMTQVINGVEKKTEDVYIGELPVMLKSKLCYLKGKNRQELIALGEDPLDFGGYFIINGIEKSLMTLEDLAPNRVFVSREKDKDLIQAKVFSTRGGFRGRCTVDRNREGRLSVTLPSYSKSLELILVLHALGLDKEEKIFEAFTDSPEVKNDLLLNLELAVSRNRKEALQIIGKRAAPGQPEEYQVKRAELLLDRYLLPHIGVGESDRLSKAFFLCRMAEHAILVAYKKRVAEDKDHYSNKRVKIAGKLMEELFRYAFQFLVKDVAYQMERANVRGRKMSLYAIVRPDALTERIKYAMATGNWVGGHTGVCQPIDRYNYISAVSYLKRVVSPLAKKHPHYKARDLNGTHWGRLDPNETPEGPNCVAPDTQVLTSDYTALSISDLGEKGLWADVGISAFDWSRKKICRASVARYLKREPVGGKAFEVRTLETNRRVVATADHPFYSQNGKVPLSVLKPGDKVAVLPLKPLDFEPVESALKVLVDENGLRKACPPKTSFEYVARELEKRGLLPLKASDSRVSALARLVGHVFGHGALSYSMKKFKSNTVIVFTGGSKDLDEIAVDVRALGFNVSKETTHTATSISSDGRMISGVTHRRACYSKPLWVLLRALGAPVGDKTVSAFRVPEWIVNGKRLFAREFLAAFFGSEMSTPRVLAVDGKTFATPCFSLNKSVEKLDGGLAFCEDVKKLLEKFNVRTSHVKVVYGIKRKDGSETRKIKFFVNSDLENLLNLYGTIGFAYSPRKRMLARFAFEYLLTKKNMLEERTALREKAFESYCNGSSKKQILEALNGRIRTHDLRNWLAKTSVTVRVSEKDFPKFADWIANHALSEDGLVWETVASIKQVECRDVRDITTLEETHNFFANGFLTGNCGLIKNLALFCEVSTGAEEKKVENTLRKLGVSLKL